MTAAAKTNDTPDTRDGRDGPDLRAIDTASLEARPCPEIGHELRVLLPEEAFDRIVERGAADTSREIGGVLVGELLRDAAGPYLRITATIDALHAEEKGAELTFTHATWKHIHEEMDGKHQGQRVIGWYHTHPGFGIFLSDRDQFIHQSFFDLPFQVAFVYDPKSREHGMFAWRRGAATRMRRFWIGGREQTWDGDRQGRGPEGGKDARGAKSAKSAKDDQGHRPARADHGDAAEPAAPPPPELGSSLPLVTFAAMLCLLLGGLAGHWLGARGNERTVQLAQLELLQLRGASTRAAVSALHGELIALMRSALDAEAVTRPLADAAATLDEIAATLQELPGGAGSGSGSGPDGSGSDGNARPPAGLLATLGLRLPIAVPVAVPVVAAAADSSTTTAGTLTPSAQPPLAAPSAPSAPSPLAAAIARLLELRHALARLALERASAQATLHAIEREAQRRDDPALRAEQRRDLGREVAAQRAGLGALYAELAAEAARAGDRPRAHRYFTTAARIDPGNRARYEQQLQPHRPSRAP